MRVADIGHCTAWNIGWLVLAMVWLGPLPYRMYSSFAIHMILHMAVVAIAAPLLAIGISGRRFDPVASFPWLFPPIVASFGELLIVWVWHAPRPHHWACFETSGFVLEQAMFLVAGLWVWLSAFGGGLPRNRERSAAGIVALLLTSMHMTLLGALLALSDRLLYAHPFGTASEMIDDQNWGGSIMLVLGGGVFLLGGLILTLDLVPLSDPFNKRRTI